MSATLDKVLFSKYFARNDSNGVLIPSPILTVPGRTFHVEKFYLKSVLSKIKKSFTKHEIQSIIADKHCQSYVQGENQVIAEETGESETKKLDSVTPTKAKESSSSTEESTPVSLIAGTIAYIAKTSTSTGGVLVFLPGWHEITELQRALEASPFFVNFGDSSKYKVYTIHSDHLDAQADVFAPEAEGVRKIVLSTNIAEASITIPDIEYVVDCGKQRESFYNQKPGTFGKYQAHAFQDTNFFISVTKHASFS